MSSLLFTTANIGNITLNNRIVVPPMCQYSAKNGSLSEWHKMHYGTLAVSGAGMLILEATAVRPEGRITPFCLGLWNDQLADEHKKILSGIREFSETPIGIQLAHAGRKGSTRPMWERGRMATSEEGGWMPVAPSAIPFGPNDPAPEALTKDTIKEIVKEFANSAKRAHEAGYNFIELHAAHGYLLHEFLSPITNKRDDEYGGSLENRMRMVIEVFGAIKGSVPSSLPVGIRISATDWVDGGWGEAESLALIQNLIPLGLAYVHVSSGGLSPDQKISPRSGYQVFLADNMRKHVNIPVITVGLITSPEQAENIVVTGQADLVAVGREMLFNPRWAWHAARELGATVPVAKPYFRSAPYTAKNLFTIE